MFLTAAGQKGALQPGACLCKYVRLPDDVTAEDASCSLIQCVCISVRVRAHVCAYTWRCTFSWYGCMVLIYSTCGLVRVLLYVLGEELQGFKQAQQTYSTRAHTHTHSLWYFISARHGWCPGPTQRAHSRVKSFRDKRSTSILKIGPFPPQLSLFYQRLSEEEEQLSDSNLQSANEFGW